MCLYRERPQPDLPSTYGDTHCRHVVQLIKHWLAKLSACKQICNSAEARPASRMTAPHYRRHHHHRCPTAAPPPPPPPPPSPQAQSHRGWRMYTCPPRTCPHARGEVRQSSLLSVRTIARAPRMLVSQFQDFVKEDTKYDVIEENMGGRAHLAFLLQVCLTAGPHSGPVCRSGMQNGMRVSAHLIVQWLPVPLAPRSSENPLGVGATGTTNMYSTFQVT